MLHQRVRLWPMVSLQQYDASHAVKGQHCARMCSAARTMPRAVAGNVDFVTNLHRFEGAGREKGDPHSPAQAEVAEAAAGAEAGGEPVAGAEVGAAGHAAAAAGTAEAAVVAEAVAAGGNSVEAGGVAAISQAAAGIWAEATAMLAWGVADAMEGAALQAVSEAAEGSFSKEAAKALPGEVVHVSPAVVGKVSGAGERVSQEVAVHVSRVAEGGSSLEVGTALQQAAAAEAAG